MIKIYNITEKKKNFIPKKHFTEQVDRAPRTDASRHDNNVATISKELSLKAVHPQDQRFTPAVLDAFIVEWNLIHGGRL